MVDCLMDGRWQIGVVQSYSQFRTEIQIALIEGGKTEWYSLDNAGSKLAPFGTKSDSAQVMDLEAAAPPLGIPLGKLPVVGMLLDAQDFSGAWYQVWLSCRFSCVLADCRSGLCAGCRRETC